MQPAVRTGFALSWASANGTALPPPSAAALARAALLLTAPAVPVRSLAETLVGTATTLARVLAACTPHSVACALGSQAAASVAERSERSRRDNHARVAPYAPVRSALLPRPLDAPLLRRRFE